MGDFSPVMMHEIISGLINLITFVVTVTLIAISKPDARERRSEEQEQ
jgi:hypothetical protein